MKEFTPSEKRRLQKALLRWYRRNKRAMPWRGTHDAYRIWLSEVMLQQTRVATVLDYYARFLRRFPNVRALARARSEEVLRLWAGLGYYRRAHNLHAAAKQVVAQHGGKFPASYQELRALPGIGDYTAAAIASIAFDLPHAVLDGNVARVLARLFAVRGDLRAPAHWRALQHAAQALLPAVTPSDWNQTMMELGAVVCTPRSPDCPACPVAEHCRARKMGIAGQLPQARGKRAVEEVHLAALVVLDAKGKTLLTRETNEYFSRMWQFPAAGSDKSPRKAAGRLLRQFAPQVAPGQGLLQALALVRHTVTFRNLFIHPFAIQVQNIQEAEKARAFPLIRIASMVASSATRKIAATVREHFLRASRN